MAPPAPSPAAAEAVLRFWFGDDPEQPLANSTHWFQRSDDFDAQVRTRFAALVAQAEQGELEAWRDTPRTALALVILLDQFTRNLHRDSPRAFAFDHVALDITLRGLDAGLDAALTPVQHWFFCMPLMHAEELAVQERALEEFRKLAAMPDLPEEVREALAGVLVYAARHRLVIEKFGRFPHRNAVLGRRTTPEEAAWLEAHPDGF